MSHYSNEYINSSKISCNNMYHLAKKHQDENNTIFNNVLLSSTCGYRDGSGDIIPYEYVNKKHCNYKRNPYDTEWMDKLYGFCVGEQFNQHTKNKNISSKTTKLPTCIPSNFTNVIDYECQSLSVQNRYNNHNKYTKKH